MPKEHLNSESMSPVLKELQGIFALPEQKDIPYLIEAIINDRDVVEALISGTILAREVFGPVRPRIETQADYRCAKCNYSDIEIIAYIPSKRSVEETMALRELFEKRMVEGNIGHNGVVFTTEYV
ncbi:MAG: hypothetical protein WAN50_00100 [Minisyncoccia bacterium]